MLESLLEDNTAGDPMGKTKRTRKSTKTLSEAVTSEGIPVSPRTVATLLKDLEYSLLSNRKTLARKTSKERDLQFRTIKETRDRFMDESQPVISVDTKKKELIGNFKNPGKAYKKEAEQTWDHDFPSWALGAAIPYGLYDLSHNHGTIAVGTSHDTSEFAVDSIASWLELYGFARYPDLRKLLILCDGGGSNGYRTRAWKYFLYQKICLVYDIPVTVRHYPVGASKYNPIERRLFSFISINWAGEPLRSYGATLSLIRGTKTSTGLRVDAYLNTMEYETSIKITDDQMTEIPLQWHEELPQSNYAIYPTTRYSN